MSANFVERLTSSVEFWPVYKVTRIYVVGWERSINGRTPSGNGYGA